jgi:hypothetical protein
VLRRDWRRSYHREHVIGEITMSRVLYAFLFASVSLFALGPPVAEAASLASEQCAAENGTYDKATKTCTVTSTENVGNSSNSQTTTTTSEQTAQGNFTNPNTPPPTTECSGPGGSTSSAHCK